jgi:mycoredoxin
MSQKIEITLYGTAWCGASRRACSFFNQHHIPFCWVDIDKDEVGAKFVEDLNHGFRSVPTIIWPDGSMLVEPSLNALAKKLGLTSL